MTIARAYKMIAAEGKGDALLAALEGLADALKDIAGFQGADLMRDVEKPEHFMFIEKWASVQAHKDGGPSLPKEALAPVMGALAGAPDGAYLEYVREA